MVYDLNVSNAFLSGILTFLTYFLLSVGIHTLYRALFNLSSASTDDIAWVCTFDSVVLLTFAVLVLWRLFFRLARCAIDSVYLSTCHRHRLAVSLVPVLEIYSIRYTSQFSFFITSASKPLILVPLSNGTLNPDSYCVTVTEC